MIIKNYDIFNLPLVQNTNLEGYRVPLECYSRSIAYRTLKKNIEILLCRKRNQNYTQE